MKKLLLFALGGYAIFMLSCASEKSDFAKAKRKNSIQAYEAFLQKYPQGEFKTEATKSLHELAFHFVMQKDSLYVYKEYVKIYPESEFLSKVNERIEDLTFQAAKQKDDLQSYQDFLKEYPTSKYLNETKERIDLLILESTQIEGRVFRTDTNEPFSNASVFLKKQDLEEKRVIKSLPSSFSESMINVLLSLRLMDDADNNNNLIAETRSDKQGFYLFSRIKPGKYYLLVRIDNSKISEKCTNNINGWISSSWEISDPSTNKVKKSSSFFAARGKIFNIKAGDQLQKDIEFVCK